VCVSVSLQRRESRLCHDYRMEMLKKIIVFNLCLEIIVKISTSH
jgi:hypothetical protein